MNRKQFEVFVRENCKSKGIVFLSSPEDKIKTIVAQQPCGGFFEENHEVPATLGIAEGLDDETFFGVLGHEYCHSQQWEEKDPTWINAKITKEEILKYSQILNKDLKGYEVGDLVHLWIEKELELEKEDLDSFVKRVTDVEFDCEIRMVTLINGLKLEIDSKEYAQKANAYLLTYFFAKQERIWPPKAAYRIPEVFTQLPTEVSPEFCQNLTPALVALYYKYCFDN